MNNGDTSSDPSSATQRSYARLRRMIVTGEIAPGAKLKVERLKTVLATGATPIREALGLLTSDQLVERTDQRGYRAAPADRARFMEILALRCSLEGLALRESIAQATPTWDEQLLRALGRAAKTEPDDFEQGEVWHKAFHMTLLDGCQMPLLRRLCDQLYDLNIRYRYLAGQALDYGRRNVCSEHADIVAAARVRDADLAVSRLVKHYNMTGAYLADRLD